MTPDLWGKTLADQGAEIRRDIGDRPAYVSYDIDGHDPVFAPDTGTPEISGKTTAHAMDLIRSLRGLNIVGCDIVDASAPYDPSGKTDLVAAPLLFELPRG